MQDKLGEFEEMLKEKRAERLEQRCKERKQRRKIEAAEVKKAEEEKLSMCDMIAVFPRPIAVYSMRVRAVDALPCQNDVLSCQSHDMLHPVHPRKCSMCTRPFPSLRTGSGNKTRVKLEL